METANPPIDRLETRVSGNGTPGMGPWDLARFSPSPNISRDYGIDVENRRVKGTGQDIMNCRGAAVGERDDGTVRHIRTWHGRQRFIGFHDTSIDAEKSNVKSRGIVWLFVHGAGKIGSLVYADAPDSFSVEQGAHGVEMGRIVAFETDRQGRAIVGFKSHDDARPYPGPELARRQR
jgi:hypothetical protein